MHIKRLNTEAVKNVALLLFTESEIKTLQGLLYLFDYPVGGEIHDTPGVFIHQLKDALIRLGYNKPPTFESDAALLEPHDWMARVKQAVVDDGGGLGQDADRAAERLEAAINRERDRAAVAPHYEAIGVDLAPVQVDIEEDEDPDHDQDEGDR